MAGRAGYCKSTPWWCSNCVTKMALSFKHLESYIHVLSSTAHIFFTPMILCRPILRILSHATRLIPLLVGWRTFKRRKWPCTL